MVLTEVKVNKWIKQEFYEYSSLETGKNPSYDQKVEDIAYSNGLYTYNIWTNVEHDPGDHYKINIDYISAFGIPYVDYYSTFVPAYDAFFIWDMHFERLTYTDEKGVEHTHYQTELDSLKNVEIKTGIRYEIKVRYHMSLFWEYDEFYVEFDYFDYSNQEN